MLRAVDLLAETDVDVIAVSQLRETEPVGVVEQPPFLNGAVALETSLPPRELLERLLEVERSLGRDPRRCAGGRASSISTCSSTATSGRRAGPAAFRIRGSTSGDSRSSRSRSWIPSSSIPGTRRGCRTLLAALD